MSDARGYKECYTWQINLGGKKMKKLSYDVSPSYVSMFKIKRFVDVNELNLTKMNPNHILGQGRRRSEIP